LDRVAAPIIDAHAAVPGGGVRGAGTMFLILGTSTCPMLMAENEGLVERLPECSETLNTASCPDSSATKPVRPGQATSLPGFLG